MAAIVDTQRVANLYREISALVGLGQRGLPTQHLGEVALELITLRARYEDVAAGKIRGDKRVARRMLAQIDQYERLLIRAYILSRARRQSAESPYTPVSILHSLTP